MGMWILIGLLALVVGPVSMALGMLLGGMGWVRDQCCRHGE